MNFVRKNKLEKIYFATITQEYGLLGKINYEKYICKNNVEKITQEKLTRKNILEKISFAKI